MATRGFKSMKLCMSHCLSKSMFQPLLVQSPLNQQSSLINGRCVSMQSSVKSALQSEAENQDDRNIDVEISSPFLSYKMEAPEQKTQTCARELLDMFHMMTIIRRFEIAADTLFKQQLVRGFCHLYDGQEAIAVGMEAGLTRQDSIVTAYRDHGTFLARGGTLKEAAAEIMGKENGCANGKGGSMHLYKRKNNFFGGWGIVGTPGPLGTGLGFALHYGKQENVAVAMYGDGAANQGQIYEAMNMGALWNLPVIYLVENNHYGMGTAEWRASKQTSFFDRITYIPGLKVDGMDAFAVKQSMQFAKDHCLSGKGPIILEMDTYRYHGHSMSDPGSTYRTRMEIKDVRSHKDPISHIRHIIVKEGVASEDDLKRMERECRSEVEDAVSKARDASQPETPELYQNVYVSDKGFSYRGCDYKNIVYKLP